jgi:hypothetical protein
VASELPAERPKLALGLEIPPDPETDMRGRGEENGDESMRRKTT